LHWRQVIPYFVAHGFKTICIDLRGLGFSHAAAGHFGKENLAREVQEVVKQVHGVDKPYSVAGHDWGGSVAIALAAISNHVSSVVVEEELTPGAGVAIPEPGASRYPAWHGGFHRQKPLAETLIAGNEQAYFQFFLRLRSKSTSLLEQDEKAFLEAYGDSARLPIILDYYRTHLEDAAFYRKLSRRRMATPALALGGKFAMGLAVREGMQKVFSHVEHHVFDDSGHYPAQEEPKLYSERVISFLYGATRD